MRAGETVGTLGGSGRRETLNRNEETLSTSLAASEGGDQLAAATDRPPTDTSGPAEAEPNFEAVSSHFCSLALTNVTSAVSVSSHFCSLALPNVTSAVSVQCYSDVFPIFNMCSTDVLMPFGAPDNFLFIFYHFT